MTYLKNNLKSTLIFLHQLKHIEVTTWEVDTNHEALNQGIQRQQK